MFTTDKVIPELPLSGQSAYLDYVRYRYRMDEQYKVGPGLEAADRYLYWYLVSYRGQEKRRVPLSAQNIDYLNAPMVMGGQQFSLTRMMWWRLIGRADMMGQFNLNDRESYLDVLFWWAHQDSPHIFFEDCLVPDRFVDFLRGVHPSRRLDAWPLSYFTERFFKDTPRLHFLKPGTAEGRKTLVLAMLVMAARRPDLLRYIPRSLISRLLAQSPDGGPSEFENFVNQLRAGLPATAEVDAAIEAVTPSSEPEMMAPVSLPYARYVAALRHKHFDLVSYSFMTRDRDGNRFEAAALPQIDPEARLVDVQLIGPLAKASGPERVNNFKTEAFRL